MCGLRVRRGIWVSLVVPWRGKNVGLGGYIRSLTSILNMNCAGGWGWNSKQGWHGAWLGNIRSSRGESDPLEYKWWVVGWSRDSELMALNPDLKQQGGLPGGKYILETSKGFIGLRKRWQFLCHLGATLLKFLNFGLFFYKIWIR